MSGTLMVSGTVISVGGFLLLLLAGVALDVRGRRGERAVTAAQALAAALRTTRGRVVVLACWMWLGIHFLAR